MWLKKVYSSGMNRQWSISDLEKTFESGDDERAVIQLKNWPVIRFRDQDRHFSIGRPLDLWRK